MQSDIKSFMEFLYLGYYACLRLRFLDVENIPGLLRHVPAVCRMLYSNVRGLAWNLSDLTVASFQYYILLCSETLVLDMRSYWFPDAELLVPWYAELLVPWFGRPVLLCRGKMPRLHTWEMVTEHFANPNLSVVVAKYWFLGSVVLDRIIMCAVFTATLTKMTRFLIVYCHQWLPCRLPLSCLWVIWMAIISSGWVLPPRTAAGR